MSVTGHGQRERDRGEGGRLWLPLLQLTDVGTSGLKEAHQCPEVPVSPQKPSRWPSTQAREDPESPFFWLDLFPRGDNGSNPFSWVSQGCTVSGELTWASWEILEPWGIKTTCFGDKVSLLLLLPPPICRLPVIHSKPA